MQREVQSGPGAVSMDVWSDEWSPGAWWTGRHHRPPEDINVGTPWHNSF